MARTPVLTDDRIAIIKQALEDGHTREMAAAKAGISDRTFYKYQKINAQFSQIVFTAIQTAHTKAVSAFRSGLEEQKEYKVSERTHKETRLDAKGQPYQYADTIITRETTTRAPDWKAGEAWLKRRDPKNWADRLVVDFNLDIELVYKFAQAVSRLGDDPTEVVRELIEEFDHERLINSSN